MDSDSFEGRDLEHLVFPEPSKGLDRKWWSCQLELTMPSWHAQL